MHHTWRDVEEVARDLRERHPETDPLSLTLAQVRGLVLALPDFRDEAAGGTDPVLEAIQAAWYDEIED